MALFVVPHQYQKTELYENSEQELDDAYSWIGTIVHIVCITSNLPLNFNQRLLNTYPIQGGGGRVGVPNTNIHSIQLKIYRRLHHDAYTGPGEADR